MQNKLFKIVLLLKPTRSHSVRTKQELKNTNLQRKPQRTNPFITDKLTHTIILKGFPVH